MSTRSYIGVSNNDGTAKVIYCHWDGYPEYVGAMLLKHWNSRIRAEKLIKYGDMSVIGEIIGRKHSFDRVNSEKEYREKHQRECLFYHRDRGEEGCMATIERCDKPWGNDYNYLFKDGKWYYREDGETWMELTKEVCKLE